MRLVFSVLLFFSFEASGLPTSVQVRCQQLWAKRFVAAKTDFQFLSKYQVLLVPGFLSDVWGEKPFRFQKRVLRNLHATYEQVPIHSSATIKANAETIRASIEESAQPVVLITHSKGALDTLHAILAQPALQPKIAGWIILQSPLNGSCLADMVYNNRLLDRSLRYALARCGGSPAVIEDLTTQARQAYMESHALPIAELGRTFPILNVTSEVPHEAPLSSRNYDLTGRLIWSQTGKKNDGVVAVSETYFPNAENIYFNHIDHGGIVNNTGDAHDAESLTYVLLQLLADRLDLSSSQINNETLRVSPRLH